MPVGGCHLLEKINLVTILPLFLPLGLVIVASIARYKLPPHSPDANKSVIVTSEKVNDYDFLLRVANST